MIWLAPEFRAAFGESLRSMADVFAISGRVYRAPPGVNRRTLRFERAGHGYFLKLHWGVGWREIVKNLAAFRLPVLGARSEWRALRRLQQLHVETMRLAAYGWLGFNPARLRSFIVTRELADCISLEDYCADWLRKPPPPSHKRRLIRRLAHITRTLHENGVNHRDYYLCHFLLQQPWDGSEAGLHLFLIDLHRVQQRARTPQRWRVKDLAALYFSALHCGLSRRDLLRFVRDYSPTGLQQLRAREAQFWRAVEAKAQQLDRSRPIPRLEQAPVLELAQGGGTLEQLKAVRTLPGKRTAALARWRGQPVFVKIFQDPRRRRRHWQREIDGLQAMHEAGVLCPRILHAGAVASGNWPLLILERIEPAKSFLFAWQQSWNKRDRLFWLECLVDLVAQHHAAGLCQTDPHLENFLVAGDRLYTLDGAGVHRQEQPIDVAGSLDNLALVLAQLLPEHDRWVGAMAERYARSRAWAQAPRGQELLVRVRSARAQRWREYRPKLLRECSEFAALHHPYGFQVVRRSLASGAMWRLLAAPDASFDDPQRALKLGNTCTLWRAEVEGRELAVKRYNVKSFWHGVKLSLRPSRADISWNNGNLLRFHGIPTPLPIALVKQRRGPWRTLSYYISQYLPGEDALRWFSSPVVPWEEKQRMAQSIADLLSQLQALGIAHGDLKASNILITGNRPVLLDLDALRRYRSRRRFARAWERDRQRFRRNWSGEPELQRLFDSVLGGSAAPANRRDGE